MNAHDGAWLPPPSPLSLFAQDVHVWRAALEMDASCLQSLQRTLSEDEVTRAERFRFQRDRMQFIAARGLLRSILARYLSVEPGHLRFCYGDHGKPALAHALSKDEIRFNISHSGRLALVAVTRGRAIGIDLEHIPVDFDWRPITEEVFSIQERAALQTLPLHMRRRAFFLCWTRKEAYVKARGQGFALSPDRVEVPLTIGGPAIVRSTGGDNEGGSWWSVQSLYPDEHYVAAVAAGGRNWRLACWQWPERGNRVFDDVAEDSGTV